MPVSLHTHSWYSLLEGTSGPEALLARALAGGHTSLALTDTNNLYGAVAFADAAARLGVRPILGACLRQARRRCVALVAGPAGYRNLCRVISRLHLSCSPLPRSGGEGPGVRGECGERLPPALTPRPFQPGTRASGWPDRRGGVNRGRLERVSPHRLIQRIPARPSKWERG